MYKSLFETEGNGVEVEGYLDLSGCKNLTSLGKLKSVGRYLYLDGCENLTSLGNLESVGGKIYLEKGSKIKILDFLKEKIIYV